MKGGEFVDVTQPHAPGLPQSGMLYAQASRSTFHAIKRNVLHRAVYKGMLLSCRRR